MRIRWTGTARRDFEGIVDYISRDNPAAAERVGASILEAAASLATMENRGRPSRRKSGRELVLAPLPYIIEYRVQAHEVLIVRIWHGKQRR